MSDFINKIVSIILIFIMLVLAPLLISYMTNNMKAQRLVLNDVTSFIDKVTDKGSISQSDLDQLYLDVNSHGLILDVDVKRLIKTATKLPDGTIKTVYFAAQGENSSNPNFDGTIHYMNTGDVVQVTVREIGISTVRQLTYRLLKVDTGRFEFTLSGAVR